jgi:GxxExxY protein
MMNHRGAEAQRKNLMVMEEPWDPLTQQVIGAAIEVHRVLGPGLLESAYEECLCLELSLRGIPFHRQVPLPIAYKGVTLECGYRMDLVVPERLVIEVKTVEKILSVHEAQLLTYLRLSGIKTGLLINFHTAMIKDGIRRMVL